MPLPLVTAIAELREAEALRLAAEMLEKGSDPLVIIEASREGVQIIGERFQEGLCFLPELVMAGEILSGVSKVVQAEVAGAASNPGGDHIVIGTVKGDIHDIGKNIVVFMLEANGFAVRDLGVDVPAESFVSAVVETQARVVGLSALLTNAYEPMKRTVRALEGAGVRDRVRVMIGGVPADETVQRYIGADAWGKDAAAAVGFAKKWTAGE